MDHTKEYTELAVQIRKLMERAEDLKRDNDSLRSALAEKTAQVGEAWTKIEGLRSALKRQFWRAQAERAKVERLREFAEHIDQRSRAYPEEIFPTPTPGQIDQVCKTLGFRIDGIAAMVLRETVKPFGKLAREALAATAPGKDDNEGVESPGSP